MSIEHERTITIPFSTFFSLNKANAENAALRQQLRDAQADLTDSLAHNAEVRKRLATAKEALEFYGERKYWPLGIGMLGDFPATHDMGMRARQALRELEGK